MRLHLMFSAVVVFLVIPCMASGSEQLEIDCKISAGGEVSTIVGGQILVGVDLDSNSQQKISVTIQDPNNPDEPWEVTSYRRNGESNLAFVQRHRDMVDSVREALNGDEDTRWVTQEIRCPSGNLTRLCRLPG